MDGGEIPVFFLSRKRRARFCPSHFALSTACFLDLLAKGARGSRGERSGDGTAEGSAAVKEESRGIYFVTALA